MTACTGTAGQEPAAGCRIARSKEVHTFVRNTMYVVESTLAVAMGGSILQLRSIETTGCARAHT